MKVISDNLVFTNWYYVLITRPYSMIVSLGYQGEDTFNWIGSVSFKPGDIELDKYLQLLKEVGMSKKEE